MSWSQSVFSSVVSEVGYDSDTGELLVTWSKSGKVSAYQGVPEDVAQRLANAPSVGQMINDEIKPYFLHSYR
jgi:KTSC domain